MSANWDASFETREQDKNSKPQSNFVALLVVEGGIGHSGRLCVCGWWQCGKGHRVRWGAGRQSPMGSPSMLSLHQGESIRAGLAIQTPWPKKARLCHHPVLTPYVRQPCSASSSEDQTLNWLLLSTVSLPIPITQVLQAADFEKCFPSSPLLAPFPPTSQMESLQNTITSACRVMVIQNKTQKLFLLFAITMVISLRVSLFPLDSSTVNFTSHI